MMKYLDDTGLSYFWGKLKTFFAPKAHTHNAFETKHSYTVAVNAAKNWYRIANANTSQTDTTKPIHAQFILTAYNASYDTNYYERWFVNAEVFGRNAHIVILGNNSAPFSQARILYENTIADLDANDRPAIDIYLNYQLANGTTKIEIEEVYNSGWTFVNDGQISVSSVPTGFEGQACSIRGNGVERSTYADYVSYLNRQISNFTAAFTLADSYLYRSRTLNCTGTFTITIPSINSGYMWCVIKNKNTSSGVITLHPSTTSVLIDGSNADIKLQPMEYVCIHSAGTNNYSLIADGRFSIKTVASAKSLSTENPSTHTKLFYTVGQPVIGTTAGKAYEGSSSDYSLLSFPTNGTVHNTSANIQNLRLMWINSTTYFTDIFVSPNNHYIWHRNVMSGNAYGWRRLVEENVTGITAPTWNISIGGNAATASAVAWSGITSKPTTISGYDITDAKIANGTITLGSNSITPLTNDSNYVHLSGNEEISGQKVFNQLSFILKDTSVDADDYPSSGVSYTELFFVGNDHILGTPLDNDPSRLGEIQYYKSSAGNRGLEMTIRWHENSGGHANIGLARSSSGAVFGYCPSTPLPSVHNEDTDIVTRDFIPNDTRIVHTTGAEHIIGAKIFDYLRVQNRNLDYTSNTGTSNDNEYISFYDKNDLTYSAIQASVRSDSNRLGFRVMQLDNFSGEASNVPFMGLQCTANHPNGYGVCPNMDDLSNDDNVIATTYWVRRATGNTTLNAATASDLASGSILSIAKGGTGSSTQNFIDLTTVQTVKGLKTFYGDEMDNYPEFGYNYNHSILFRGLSRRDSLGSSCGFIRRYRQNTAQGVSNNSAFSIGIQENSTWKTQVTLDSVYTVSSSAIDCVLYFEPVVSVDGSNNKTVTITKNLGSNNYSWDNVYANSGPWSGSDARMKDDIEDPSEELLDAWQSVGFKVFTFKDAKVRKGSGARLHVGVVAQDVQNALASKGLDAGRYGFFGYDKWDAKYEDGSLVQDAGDRYSIRYEEALALECACLRRRVAMLEKRLAALEESSRA